MHQILVTLYDWYSHEYNSDLEVILIKGLMDNGSIKVLHAAVMVNIPALYSCNVRFDAWPRSQL